MTGDGQEATHDPGEQYDGPALVDRTPVVVRLRGHFQPIDGLFHWWGRLAPDAALGSRSSGSTITLVTPHGQAQGRLSDVDPWGRFRISGTGRPPF
jgi:hypothetical protein